MLDNKVVHANIVDTHDSYELLLTDSNLTFLDLFALFLCPYLEVVFECIHKCTFYFKTKICSALGLI
jgi:hypothetical protein